MGYTGQRPSAVPLTTADLIDGSITNADIADLDAAKLTGTVNNARISLDAAEIPNLDTAKLTTGTVASARLGTGTASSTTVLYGDGTYKAEPTTDLTPVKNDISLLALQTAINGNMSAYGLKNSWIEQFENSTYIEALTQVSRVTSDEYLASVYTADTVVTPSSGDWTGDTGSFTLTSGGADSTSGDDSIKSNWTSGTGDFTVQLTVTVRQNQVFGMYPVSEDGSFASNDDGGMHSMTNSWWWEGNSTGNATYPQHSSNTQTAFSGGVAIEDGDVVQMKRVSGTISIFIGGVSRHTYSQTSTADLRFVVAHHGTTTGNIQSMTFTNPASADNATGSFNSTDVVPQDATNKSSVGLVVLYKDQAGTNTLNTDIVAKVRANTGQAYQTLVLAGAGTYSNSLKIAIAPAIAVTAGQALSYQISFANQASSSKEARIYGVAMTY